MEEYHPDWLTPDRFTRNFHTRPFLFRVNEGLPAQTRYSAEVLD